MKIFEYYTCSDNICPILYNILYFQDLKYEFSYQDKYFSLSMYVHIANIEHFYTRSRNIHS